MEPERLRDYQIIIEELHNSDDIELQKIGKSARSFFTSPVNAPPDVAFDDLVRDVKSYFPTPFAGTFLNWTSRRNDFNTANSADEEDVSFKFRASFDGVWSCWRQIVHFLPFVLLAPLSRLRSDLEKKGGKILARAFAQYQSFYQLTENEKESDRKKFEGQQCQLLENLVELCTELSDSPDLPRGFFFNALLDEQRDFKALFPNRFAIELKFIQLTRNRIEHGGIAGRTPQVLRSVSALVDAAFLDMVSIIADLSKAYGIYYVDDIAGTANHAIANTWSFSGLEVTPARFALHSGGTGSASIDKFVPKHIYLIDRRRELARDPKAEALDPRDYVDLTPFIIERGRVEFSKDEKERRLYALDEYRSADRTRFIRFLDLAGRALRRLPRVSDAATDRELRELSDLFEEIEGFSGLVEGLADYILLRRSGSMDFPVVRRRAWDRISKHQLESIVNAASFAYDGSDVPTTSDAPLCSYDRELYVAPAQAADLERFFASAKRGVLLVGGSGYGKTTLLASSFLGRLQAGDIAIFLTGRRLAKGSLKDVLLDVTSSIGYEWTLLELDKFVRDENAVRKGTVRSAAQVVIFIDAVNEYTAGRGAPQLLHEIVDFVATGGDKLFGRQLQNVRVVATCRTETWLAYRDSPGGIPLDRETFHCAPNGDPITVAGFDDDDMRRALYERYRKWYNLANTPYEKLAPAVSDLFRSPLMLSLIAETYGTRVSGETGRKIPRDLNYYEVFNELKKRKLADSKFLVPAGSRRDTIGEELRLCLQTFSTLLYERMVFTENPRDYVGIEQTARDPMAEFSKDRSDLQITPLRALREIGIITSKVVSEFDANMNERQGRAFTFFHDRYAEYELAAVYGQSVLRMMTKDTVRNPSELARLSREIERLVDLAKAFPVLSGALDHWFQMNLRFSRGEVGVLVPLCNRLSLSESGIARGKASEVLTGFVLRGSVPAKALYKAVFSAGGASLRIDMATALADSWPAITGDMVREFLEACDPARDELVIETLADAFAEHANSERRSGDGSSAIAFVAQVCPDLTGLVIRLLDLDRVKTHLKFLIRFTQITIITCAERPAILLELRDFLVRQFRPIIDFIVGRQSGNAFFNWSADKLRGFIREQLERSVYGAWEDTLSCGGINDTFFVDDNGVVQRDALLEYIPYMCAIHNRDSSLLSLADGSPYLDLALKMLNYRKYSVLGFAAYASLTIAIGEDHAALRRIVSKVMNEGSDAGRFVAANIIGTYSKVQRSFAREALSIVAEEMIPLLVDEVDALGHQLICAAGIAETDIEANWEYLIPSLDAAFEHMTRRADPDDMLTLGRELRCMTFFGESRIGTKFMEYIIKAGYLDESSEWRPAALEICAGMLTRHRTELLRLFAQYGVPDSTFRESEVLKTQEVLDQQRSFGARARWDGFFVRAVAHDKRLSYLLFKHVFGSLALCNSVSEWATETGTFMIEAIRVYSGASGDDDPRKYDKITVEDIYASTPVRPIPGGGKRYVPRRKAPTKTRER